ncbi:outer membrane protein [Aquabacter spiritensis]|uniref:Opacity protein-like surface antigen n=1 Tax=Aquabacter spiritensis TaxID=933073 RepID=A0A4R3LUR7_9HYPH|nr:outer membrane beta-barrel protein [Aquabacter spiritensis]TCT04293.1 opacity protein-like surface antigen [Aquabacter spiritensis]
MPPLHPRLSTAAVLIATVAGAGAPARAADPILSELGRPGDFTLAAPELDEAGAALAGWYLRADIGANFVSRDAVHQAGLGAPDGQRGWTAGAGVGYRVVPHIRTDLTLDYLTGGSARALSLMGNVYWDIATVAGLTPYVGAGAGIGWTKSNGFAFAPLDVDGWSFGWNVSAGIAWTPAPQVSLDAGYRFLDFGTPSNSMPALWGVSLSGRQAHQVRIGFRYALN